MSPQDLSSFDNYTNNTLSQEERSTFEKRLSSDLDFATSFGAYKTAIKAMEIEKFRKHVTENYSPPHRRFRFTMIAWLVLIFIVFISTLIFFTTRKSTKIDRDQLFAQHFQPYQNLTTTRSGTTNMDRALAAYIDQDYENALSLFDTTLYKSDLVKFYRSICRLAQTSDQTYRFEDEARYLSPNHPFQEQLNWYQALSYLKRKEYSKAKLHLKDIGKGQYKYDEAINLIRQIENSQE